MNYYRVKTGYKPTEFLPIDETELITAIHAQISGKIGVFKSGTIRGNDIISIKPDLNKIMGYNESYVMTEQDMAEVPRKHLEDHRLTLENAGEMVKAKMENRPPVLKEPTVKIHKGMTAIGELIKGK